MYLQRCWKWSRHPRVRCTENGRYLYTEHVTSHPQRARSTAAKRGVRGAGVLVVGYVRVSTDEQATSGLGLDAQRAAIADECTRRGWELVEVFEDAGASGKSMVGRPALQEALDAVRSHRAGALVVAKLDRLSRSLLDFAALMEDARKEGWALVILDLGVDTTTPSGEMIANVMATFAQFERRLIGQRTKDALAVKKRQGVKLGRPQSIGDNVVKRIRRERKAGKSLRVIANSLNDDGVPTGHGGVKWHASTVRAVLGETSARKVTSAA
jgi:DNA invertase Pin-like site-specific DNA recombinase